MSRAVLRHWVLVNDQPQELSVAGAPLHVAAGLLGVGVAAQHIVEFWAEGDVPVGDRDEGLQPRPRLFQVFGTGHPLPAGAVWRGTTDRTADGLVWHLYELPPPARTCRVCGCTNERACVWLDDSEQGGWAACSWVEADLCSSCRTPASGGGAP